jgi:hypothetical protein
MTGTRVIDWRPFRKPPFLGFCKLQYASGITLAEVAVMRGANGNTWAGAPTRPLLKNGVAMLDMDGKVRHAALIGFPTKEIRNQWSDAVIAALRQAYPSFDSEAEEAFEE